jgi:hypothetical protein
LVVADRCDHSGRPTFCHSRPVALCRRLGGIEEETAMTVYSLTSNLPDDSFADWTDIALWQSGHVPDDPSAQVFLNTLNPDFYFVEVLQGEHISIGSLNIQSNNLLIY